jgi:MoxR-like ATPase
MNIQTTPSHPKDKELFLPATGTWLASWYLLEGKFQDAIQLAEACGRPLLVRGLPGTGKSDLARAAAEYLNRAFVYEVVTARTEPQELLWRFDAIARLADAQALGASVKKSTRFNKTNLANPTNAKHYVSPGVLWWAINWDSAEQQLSPPCNVNAQRPDRELTLSNGQKIAQQDRAQSNGCVLLLDEIDKADSELPNSLLEVLANTGFRLPWGDAEIKAHNHHRPVIIITTNEDRELPPAFVRRCLVLNIAAGDDFSVWIKERARVHFRDPDDPAAAENNRPVLSNAILNKAASYLETDGKASPSDSPKPGLAEYLDLLKGLHQLTKDEAEQEQWLDRVYQFAYQKHVTTRR